MTRRSADTSYRPRFPRIWGLEGFPAGLAVLGVERQLEPDRLAFRGRARAPAGGQLLDQIQAPAALVGRAGGAQPGQPQVGVEGLDPDRLGAASQPEGELAGPVARR